MNAQIRKINLVAGIIAVMLARGSLCVAADSTTQGKAAAEALFQDGTALAARGNLAQACEKFEASQQLDPAPGTMLRLADCYDRIGKTASAWAWFHQVLSLARGEHNERAQIAAERVSNLESRLAKIDIQVPVEARSEGLEVRLNGANVPSASWGVALPVDPGLQHLEFSAPGHQKQVDTILVSSGPSTRVVIVPRLTHLASVGTLPSERDAAGSNMAQTRVDQPTSLDGHTSGHQGAARRWERTVGYTLGGVGIATLGLGALFAYRAYDANQHSLDYCSSRDANACTPAGKAARDDAQSFAAVSTGTVLIGATLIGAGAVLVLWSPHNDQPSRPNPSTSGRLRFTTARNVAGLAFEGQW